MAILNDQRVMLLNNAQHTPIVLLLSYFNSGWQWLNKAYVGDSMLVKKGFLVLLTCEECFIVINTVPRWSLLPPPTNPYHGFFLLWQRKPSWWWSMAYPTYFAMRSAYGDVPIFLGHFFPKIWVCLLVSKKLAWWKSIGTWMIYDYLW